MADNLLKPLIKKRGIIKARQTNFRKHVDSVKAQIANQELNLIDKNIITELEIRLNDQESIWEQFGEVQSGIEELVEDEESTNKQIEERINFENFYFKVKAEVRFIVESYYELTKPIPAAGGSEVPSVHSEEAVDQASQHMSLKGVKLPPINLQKFSGDFKNWLEFRDLFDSLIHSNQCIPKIQKFHYLRASLEGGAAQVIRSIELAGDNYDIAWSTLLNRYDNRSLLVQNHVKSLFNLPGISVESAYEIRKLIDNISKHVQSLKSLKQPTESWDTLLIHLFCGKLDKKTARDWEENKIKKHDGDKVEDELPTLKQFVEFLKQKADLLDTLDLSKLKVDQKGQGSRNVTRSFATINQSCVLCKHSHMLQNCPEFLRLSVNGRVEKVKELRLCFNCLKGNHSVRACTASTCRKCKRKHNSLLHFENISAESTGNREVSRSEQVSNNSQTEIQTAVNIASEGDCTQVLLQTVLVQVLDSRGIPRTCRALLDGASQSNLITYECCNKLGLEKKDLLAAVTGIGQSITHLKHRCNITVQSCHNRFSSELSCLVIPKVSGTYPASTIDMSSWNIPKHLRLADPEFYKPGEIDILIGGGIYLSTLCVGQIRLGSNLPMLQKTQFGWVLGGEVIQQNSIPKFHCSLSTNLDIQDQLARFWELETTVTEKVWSAEEKQCDEIFEKTTTRNKTGRFIVQIPFKKSPELLGDSRQTALKRFYSLESKFVRNPELKEKYVKFMEEYESLGHMVKVNPGNAESKLVFYFPHHGVSNEQSLTTKLRVVFDGSSPSDSGLSLNDIQFVGPMLQDDLMSVILRFREHRIVVCADVVKMYRQISIDPKQRSLQRILWRSDPSLEIETFELQTVTYGTTSAPYLAVRCLQQLARDHEVVYPRACKVILRDFYMDDMLTGTESVEAAVQLCEEVSSILSSGGFELQKWASNSKHVMDHVTSKSGSKVMKFGENERTKTLGLYWECDRDHLMFSIGFDCQLGQITKRTVLSNIAQIFDPLGLLGPCIVIAKVIMQRLWLCKLSWDESLPIDIHTRWKQFRTQLSGLNELRIPRPVVCEQPECIEIHGFADASLQAYGACVYLRSANQHGHIVVRLLCSKSRVAPLKTVTIPRLELCAALLLADLMQKVKSSLTLEFSRSYYWTDSTVCLNWIRTPPNILQTFVGNRVSQIQQVTRPDEWYHVRTYDNPADLLSRGVDPNMIQDSELWWCGPTWLVKEKNDWPESKFQLSDAVPELKKQVRILKVEYCELFPFNRFSSLSRLTRVMAYCQRFIKNCRSKHRDSSPIMAIDIQNSLSTLVKLAQREMFPDELKALTHRKEMPGKSKLNNLNPFLDSEGILRVGGRIQLGNFDYEKKHPAVLCGQHIFTKLLFRSEHLRLLHAGPQHLLSAVRERFWPLGGRNLARQTIHGCVRCFRVRPKQTNPIMGLLPKSRLMPAPPFSNCGVDYAGPLYIKNKRGRGASKSKCYIALFICMVTKAVHLELVTDLTKEAFLAALSRFIARRGKPLHLYSDNGTNFVGANRELEALGKLLIEKNHELAESSAQHGINWHFIPALAPHFGGLWEAGVKSCKSHLKRVLGNASLTYEALYTVLCQIETILNSRPLTPLSSEPSDLTALTPSHFLIGKSITSLPNPDLREIKENRLSYFQRLQQLQQHFWARWSREYVSELQTRIKWCKQQPQLKPGALIVLKEDNTSPLQWSLGRVEQVHPGPDNIVRVATIRTVRGLVKRSVSKICPLPETDFPQSDVSQTY